MNKLEEIRNEFFIDLDQAKSVSDIYRIKLDYKNKISKLNNLNPNINQKSKDLLEKEFELHLNSKLEHFRKMKYFNIFGKVFWFIVDPMLFLFYLLREKKRSR